MHLSQPLALGKCPINAIDSIGKTKIFPWQGCTERYHLHFVDCTVIPQSTVTEKTDSPRSTGVQVHKTKPDKDPGPQLISP